jgi:hypothetical protein
MQRTNLVLPFGIVAAAELLGARVDKLRHMVMTDESVYIPARECAELRKALKTISLAGVQMLSYVVSLDATPHFFVRLEDCQAILAVGALCGYGIRLRDEAEYSRKFASEFCVDLERVQGYAAKLADTFSAVINK